MTTKVMYYVQHLLGIGHVVRSLAIVRELENIGVEVTLVLGGGKPPMLDYGRAELVLLPSARAADDSFKVLLDAEDRPIDDEWREKRRNALIETFNRIRPDALVVELFPFGRRQFRFELVPLLEAARQARPRPHVISSVRDILVDKGRRDRILETVKWVEMYFDTVLVHGDPELIPFAKTFPMAERLNGKLRYSGYVIDRARLEGALSGLGGNGEVLVSGGGGSVGENLLRTAIAARPLSSLRTLPWRLVTGPNLSEDAFGKIRDEAGEGFVVERSRSDFVALMAGSELSISQGGYNTVMEILVTQSRAVVVPFAGGGESEQTLRARLLEKRGLIKVVDEGVLSPQTLSDAIGRAMEKPECDAAEIDLCGAKKSALIISRGLRGRGA